MAKFRRSDLSGVEIDPSDYKKLVMRITLESSYLSEPIEYLKTWDLTTAEYQAIVPDAIILRDTIQAAAVDFLNAVEN